MWSRRLGGIGNDYGYGVAADSASNVYVSGSIGALGSFGGVNLTPLGPSDAFVAKYGPTGTLVWARGLGGADAETARGVASAAGIRRDRLLLRRRRVLRARPDSSGWPTGS
jgi:hypothetical protein